MSKVMGVKTVRLEPEEERRLEAIRKRTGWTVSDVLKRGIDLVAEDLDRAPSDRAWEIYASLDLGPGGDSAGPAARASEVAREVIRRKHRR